jgi:hypothetical protein
MRPALLTVLLLLTAVAPARAEERLSARGHQIVDGTTGFAWSNGDTPGSYARPPEYQLWVQPSWLYFVRDRVGVGAYVGYEYGRATQTFVLDSSARAPQVLQRSAPVHTLALGATFAFEVLTLGRVSLYARPYLGVAWVHRRRYALVPLRADPSLELQLHARSESHWQPQLGVRAPVVYQVSAQLGLGLGPDLQIDLLPGQTVVRLGFSTWIARVF